MDERLLKVWSEHETGSAWFSRGPVLYRGNDIVAVLIDSRVGKRAIIDNTNLELVNQVSCQMGVFATTPSNVAKVASFFNSVYSLQSLAHVLSSQMHKVVSDTNATLDIIRAPKPRMLEKYHDLNEKYKEVIGPVVALWDQLFDPKSAPNYRYVVALERTHQHNFNGNTLLIADVQSGYGQARTEHTVYLIDDETDAVALHLKDAISYEFSKPDIIPVKEEQS